jgi:hypothetical protein
MRSWIVRLSLLALTIGVTPPAWAGSLNDIFTFPHITYTLFPPTGLISGHGSGGQFQGMGDLTVEFRYSPDPEGGHPLARALHFFGVIPELGITEDCGPPLCGLDGLVWAGVILADPEEFPGPPGPGFLRFQVGEDFSHPALSVGGDTWDVRLPLRVPAPAAGLLLVGGGLLLALRVRRLI